MDFSLALPTFVITLREGVEAALVVGIVLAYLKKAGQTHLNSWVYSGIGAGLAASVLVGFLFNWMLYALESSSQQSALIVKPLLEGIFGVIAIALLSWMLIWMTQQARSMKTQVEGEIGSILQEDERAGWGVFSLIFVAVLREGFETVVFIATKFQQGWIPALGAIAGLVVAVGVGILLFKWGVKINLRLFFQIMGVFLLLIVAGLVIGALKHFDQAIAHFVQLDPEFASLCFYRGPTSNGSCILGPLVWDASGFLPQKQFPGVILHTLFGYTQTLYLVQAIGYLLFLFTVGGVYLQSITGWAIAPRQKEQPSIRPN